MKVAGILLAGGESRRFGSPKAFATYKGEPFYRIILNQLDSIVDRSVIVSKQELIGKFQQVSSYPVNVITDNESYCGMGPLAGIYSAMKSLDADYYITVACDMPLVTSDIFAFLVDKAKRHDASVVPVVDGRVQPLCAIYHASCKPTIEANLKAGRKRMSDFLKDCEIHYAPFGVDHKQWFMNINTSDDYKFVQEEKE
ncbi:molybdenum cofactor guanylyltransferase [Pseudalkalibacillus hwajinpoensis]|uniref:molybdenum cofactor guanylyltransferase n=1 Tax=Guptibacillus hwajinpoensis TaxID=208199 RepID=UPI00325BE555